MNILIVEDEEALAGALEHILQKAGHTTDWVADGQTALDYIRGFSYDLVLLDIMLPRLDGISVLRQARTEGIQTPRADAHRQDNRAGQGKGPQRRGGRLSHQAL